MLSSLVHVLQPYLRSLILLLFVLTLSHSFSNRTNAHLAHSFSVRTYAHSLFIYPHLRSFTLHLSVPTLIHSSFIRTYAHSLFIYPHLRSGITGRLIGLYATNNFGRPSVMIFMLCGVLVISFFLYVYDLSSNPIDLSIGAFCPR